MSIALIATSISFSKAALTKPSVKDWRAGLRAPISRAMTSSPAPRSLLYRPGQLSPDEATKLARQTLSACDDGELFLQFVASESFTFDDGRLKTADYSRNAGFGLRGVSGEMTVLLGPGWPGVLLHEAVGHGLEGDFNRKGTSAFSGRIGKRVAAPGVTVIDDGSIAARRGSLSIDDEGTPTQENILIEDGILKGYIHDRLSARLMGMEPTGNGRREGFAYPPLPRMTTTYMRGGNDDPAELLSRVKKGIFAKSFGGGQVDITNGKFVFSCTEAYLVEDGRIGAPIKGATLIGDGPSVLTRVLGLGHDMALDEGIGVCGKAGQSVAAGVGQPTVLVDALTVGGTA